jgi:hypothetical protein
VEAKAFSRFRRTPLDDTARQSVLVPFKAKATHVLGIFGWMTLATAVILIA